MAYLCLLSSWWVLRRRKNEADLGTDEGPGHGAGVQLVNVIGETVRLGWGRKEEGIEGCVS